MQLIYGTMETQSMNKVTYIADVQACIDALKAEALIDPHVEAEFGKKLSAAVELLTRKSTVTATFKRLQGNAKKDFLDKMDSGAVGYTADTRALKIKEYVYDKFKSYMLATKTTVEATNLFNAAYTTVDKDPVND
jgi:hypothetical protein